MTQVFADSEALNRALAERIVAAGRGAIASRGVYHLAISGGHTPRRAFEMLAKEPLTSQIDWRSVHVYWVDERNVPPSSPDSNERMAREAFLDVVPIPSGNVHPMYVGLSSAEAANDYEERLHTIFPANGPAMDFVHLGMGPDGHTASLFPAAGNLDSPRWVIAAETDVWSVHDRVTMTARFIAMAREVVFEVEGADKANVIAAILSGDTSFPAGYVASICGNVSWLLDRTTASALPT